MIDPSEPTKTRPESSEKALAQDLVVGRTGSVVTITLTRPKRKNALTSDMIDTITDVVRSASADDDTRAVLITSDGDDFCSGIDLAQSNSSAASGKGSKPRTGHLQRRLETGAHGMILELAAAQVPIVAAVRGWAAGVGNMLALSADVVVATPSAKFWVPFVTKGFTPDSGNTWLLPRLVGLARAKEMVLRGKPIDGERAAEWGLISQCVPEAELDSTVAAVLSDFGGGATVAIGLAKSLLHANIDISLTAALRNEAIYEELAVRSDDFKEGMRAFTEKRQPDYTGW